MVPPWSSPGTQSLIQRVRQGWVLVRNKVFGEDLASEFCLAPHYCDILHVYFLYNSANSHSCCPAGNWVGICFRGFSVSESDHCQISATAGKLCLQENPLQQRNIINLFKTKNMGNYFQTLCSDSEEQGMEVTQKAKAEKSDLI